MLLFLQASTNALYGVRDLLLIAPELILTVCACVVLVMEVVLPARRVEWIANFALLGLALALVSLGTLWTLNAPLLPVSGFYHMVRVDGFALFFKIIFLLGALFTVAISPRYLAERGEGRGEFYALVLFATVGMMMIAGGYDLLVLYISLELMALSFYVLVAFTKRERKANEAAMKYFLLGAFSSGVLLYGMSLLFGVAGSTNIGDIAPAVRAALAPLPVFDAPVALPAPPLRPLLLLGMVALAAGLFFKISAVPFHMWAPDAYEGAPTPVTAFLSTGSKAASFALFLRIFVEALEGMRADWAPLLGVVAAVTILVGNWAAVTQDNAKRLLAYSSISNAGYLLLGLIAGNNYGYLGLAIYLLVYTLMNIGAFGIVLSLRGRGEVGERVEDFAGLGRRAPFVALLMSVFLLSLGGLPATGGFIGKYFLFGGLLSRGAAEGKSWYTWLALWAILNTVVSFYYYIRFIRQMYLQEDVGGETQPPALGPTLVASLAVAGAGIIFIGVYPQPLINLARVVVTSLGLA
jgi:NADH-quinone oxidoreductase subunit N